MINTPFKLPCGVTLKNRLVKSAMTERMSNSYYEPTQKHLDLYSKWANSGAGILITGNVMIDELHLESAGNVVFKSEVMLPKLKEWAESAKQNDTHAWVQISHSGRQTNRFVNRNPKSASDVQLKKVGLFGKPKKMTLQDIEEVIKGFVKAAVIAKEAGFTGIQIHAAHGYLISQFLSPLTNVRNDEWGGSLENRSRLLIEIIRQTRQAVGGTFPIAVKLNSSDFQRGGFTEEESIEVVKMLDKEKIDLLEMSGGTYEQLAFFLMNEDSRKDSTKKREAYFIDFAKKVREITTIPLMITGGFRSYDFCNEVLTSNELDLIGMGRPFLTNLSEIPRFLKGDLEFLENFVLRTGIKKIEDSAEGGFYARQILRMANGKSFKSKMSALWCANFLILHEFKTGLLNKKSVRM